VHIPYKGAAPAMQDLLAGQVQMMFDNLANALPQVRAGKLRALAVTTLQRSPAVPELPTISESGLPGFNLSTWFGVLFRRYARHHRGAAQRRDRAPRSARRI